ncbi:ImmA/IrrE family metallo-endopeptidase [Vibrio sinensis]|uniref:ImmA/IrrE family metallo-endopeptidase n=1 Tax=Vibrio sinensis TaxID=2302434 RepID=A0A3A6QN95_9VIBR|nr:XRE family transcriptional regulator [Vibrio sinensis]RJX68643.1 ImmA/IrrE family metallo-endopeptidase [Vibrio sinensis]
MRTGVGGFQPVRLTQARESLGLTKVALATLVNVSAATVTNWENGKQSPECDKLTALSNTLNMPTHWFLKEIPFESSTPYFYRSLSSATRVARDTTKIKLDWMAEVTSTLGQWFEWPQLRLPENTKHFMAMSEEDIEVLAIEFRQLVGLGNGPIQDVVLAVENAGVICARGDVGYDKMDGVSHWHDHLERPFIFLASDKNNGVRSRFDAAHELGHVILHKHINKSEHNSTTIQLIEKQADFFAGALLLPSDSFAKDLSKPTLETFLALKRRWKVSIAAMIYRAWQLEIIDDLQKSNLFKRLSVKRWRIREPLDDDLPIEEPRILPRAVRMLTDQGVCRKEDLLDKLGLSAGLSTMLCSLPEGFFSPHQPTYDNLVNFKVPTRTNTENVHKADIININQWK